ncbi:ubiquitin-conjugating enzyme E2Q-like protein CG4502 isoform X1 [Dermacentor silvarum]|uniref:ubiquitin-conjugating enzyme E2Q-like protein CG4502 isoform X1 n=1 Tax=Dermacentor silvarum TaxID=543639 RepID=UPI001897B3C6|nr:ubiquitin-conjugating enzyme E2Q-like protein CG4502 isoform X1 [Dermacentor silvarum]
MGGFLERHLGSRPDVDCCGCRSPATALVRHVSARSGGGRRREQKAQRRAADGAVKGTKRRAGDGRSAKSAGFRCRLRPAACSSSSPGPCVRAAHHSSHLGASCGYTGDAAVTVHRPPRWSFSGRLKPRGRNRGASKPAASMAAAALRKLFRGERHRLSTGANHNEPKKKKESAEGGSRLLSLCAGKASSERGQGKAARKPAEGASPRAPGSPAAAGGGGDTAADAAAVSSSRTARSPRNRVAPCSQQAAVRARRLMRELQEIRRQQTRGQQPSFTVDLVEDNLYEWHVRLYQVDPESPLWRDMQESGVSCVQLSVSFPENFPFAPPFVRVLAPHIERGFVMEGGAICMELLTPRGWASAYTVEAILVQVAASLSKGQARIATKPGKQFNRKLAESSFRSLVKTHDKYGWVTPPLADG